MRILLAPLLALVWLTGPAHAERKPVHLTLGAATVASDVVGASGVGRGIARVAGKIRACKGTAPRTLKLPVPIKLDIRVLAGGAVSTVSLVADAEDSDAQDDIDETWRTLRACVSGAMQETMLPPDQNSYLVTLECRIVGL